MPSNQSFEINRMHSSAHEVEAQDTVHAGAWRERVAEHRESPFLLSSATRITMPRAGPKTLSLTIIRP